MNNAQIIRTAAIALAAFGFALPAAAQTSSAVAAQTLVSVTSTERIEEMATYRDDNSGEEANQAIAQMGEWLGTFDQVREGLAENNGFIRSDDELVLAFLFQPMEGESKLLRRYMNSVVAAMQVVPDTFYNDLDAKVESLWSEINRVAATATPVTGVEADAEVRSAIVERLGAAAPDAKVIRTILSGDKWVTRTNNLGIPKSQVRRGYVMYQLPGQELIVCQQIQIERDFYGDDVAVKLGYLRLQTQP